MRHAVPFVEAEDEAAFYGPKIDVQVWSAIGREFSLATNQVVYTEEGSVVRLGATADVSDVDSTHFDGGVLTLDIILNEASQVLMINERDLVNENDTFYVEVATGEQVFDKRRVELGISDGIHIEVRSGLDTTDLVKVRK